MPQSSEQHKLTNTVTKATPSFQQDTNKLAANMDHRQDDTANISTSASPSLFSAGVATHSATPPSATQDALPNNTALSVNSSDLFAVDDILEKLFVTKENLAAQVQAISDLITDMQNLRRTMAAIPAYDSRYYHAYHRIQQALPRVSTSLSQVSEQLDELA